MKKRVTDMFQKVMVQITKQKKEKSIINRIIVDVFQLNKKLKQNQPHRNTLTDTQKQQQTHRKRHEETLAKEKRKRHGNIYCKEREQQCGKRQQQQQQQQATFCKQANKKNNQVFRTFRKVSPLDRLFPYFDFPFLVYYFFRFFFSKLI